MGVIKTGKSDAAVSSTKMAIANVSLKLGTIEHEMGFRRHLMRVSFLTS
jgi:hypothetical protein